MTRYKKKAINFRWEIDTIREERLLRASKEYNISVSTRLIDRILEDIDLIIQARAERRVMALRQKEEAERELKKIIAGE